MDFKTRVDSFRRFLYQDSIPSMAVGDDRAVVHASAGEIWSTFGNFDRLTKLVLATHRFRLGASISAESGFDVRVTSLGHHSENPVEHHPGLGDLVASCYKLGGRKSDAALLSEACQIIELLLHSGDSDCRKEAIRIVEEIQSR